MSNLSEKETKAINQLKADTSFYDYELKNGNYIYELFKIEVYKKDVDIILNLVEKQQEEIEELKTITNQYQAYQVNGYGKDTIAFASKEYFDNGSFKEAPSIDELEDLQNQIAELKDKLDTKDKVIDNMADSMYNRPAYINLPYMKTKEEIKEYFYREIENE